MEDLEDPLASNERPGAAEPNLVPNESPSPSVHTVSPTASNQQNSEDASHGAGVEVEMMDQDEFEFLDGATQLGSLRSGKQ